MTTFLIVRHAAHDLLGRTFTGWMPGVHLNAHGRAQAERLALRIREFPVDAVYSSPLVRAKETAAPIASLCGRSLRVHAALGEMHLGAWTGRPYAELEQDPLWRRWNAQHAAVRAPGGETMVEVQARLSTELAALRRRHVDGFVVVVSHEDVIKSVLAPLLGFGLDQLDRFTISPASVSVVEWNSEGMRAVRVDDPEGGSLHRHAA